MSRREANQKQVNQSATEGIVDRLKSSGSRAKRRWRDMQTTGPSMRRRW
jgi:hypothetical protein